MKTRVITSLLLIALTCFHFETFANQNPAEKSANADPAQSPVRKFTFHYRFRVKDLKPFDGSGRPTDVRVWLPAPPSSDCQNVTRLEAKVPGALSEATESQYGNRILYFQTPLPTSGEFAVDIPYDVVRFEVRREKSEKIVPLDDKLRTRLLAPDKMVPTSGKPLRLLDSIQLSDKRLVAARQLYDVVDGHVVYKKEGTGWGRGDSNWVCDSGFGNCTDFHSLFISLARSRGIPARFEIGFSIPTDGRTGPVKGYHCWAWFYLDDQGWIPVDISEADKFPKMKEYYFGNLTADRITFSIGRDLDLVPKPQGEPLNFFVYPYIEVNGTPLKSDNIELQFMYEDRQP